MAATSSLAIGAGDDIDEAEAEFVIEQKGSAEDNAFDCTVGALEEIVMGDEFQALLASFSNENCQHFEDSEENKLIYTDVFEKYSELIEGSLEKKLQSAVPGFAMPAFLAELEKRGEDEVDHAVFDLLASLGDFDSFKQQMLAAKAPTASLSIAGTASKIYRDEDEDGEERPDLSDLLMASPAGGKSRN